MAKKRNSDDQIPQPHEFRDLEASLYKAQEHERGPLVNAMAKFHSRWVKPAESYANCRLFVDAYFRSDAAKVRWQTILSEDAEKNIGDVAPVFYFGFADIHELSSQAEEVNPLDTTPPTGDTVEFDPTAFKPAELCPAETDRLLANWLRDTVSNREIRKFEALIEILREPQKVQLRRGMSMDELDKFMNIYRIESPQRTLVLNVFNDLMGSSDKFPSKKQLRLAVQARREDITKAAPIIDSSNWTKTLRVLGLSGLPTDPKRERPF